MIDFSRLPPVDFLPSWILDVMQTLTKRAGVMVSPVSVADKVVSRIGVRLDELPCSWTEGRIRVQVFEAGAAMAREGLLAASAIGYWSLTKNGLQAARKASRTLPKGNLTARWFCEHMTPASGTETSDLHKLLRRAIYKYLPVSAAKGWTDEHVHNFLERSIRRDSLRTRIVDGEDIPYSKIMTYCANSGRTDIRNMATNPVNRACHGSLTVREVQARVTAPTITVWDHTSQNPDSSTDQSCRFAQLWVHVEAALKRRAPKAWETHARILAARAEGHTLGEIAIAENLPKSKVTAMLAGTQDYLRKALVGIES